MLLDYCVLGLSASSRLKIVKDCGRLVYQCQIVKMYDVFDCDTLPSWDVRAESEFAVWALRAVCIPKGLQGSASL